MSNSDRFRLMHCSVGFGILTLCSLTFVGCGGGEESAGNAEAGNSAPVTPPQPPAIDLIAATGTGREEDGKKDEGKSVHKETLADEKQAPTETPPAATPVNPRPVIGRLGRNKDGEFEEPIETVASPGAGNAPAGIFPGGNAPAGNAPAGNAPAGNAPAGQAPTVKVRPDSVAAWTEEDFFSAAREHDLKLLEAIDMKVKSAPGDASVAVLLTRLLDPPVPPAVTQPTATDTTAVPPAAGSGTVVPQQNVGPESSLKLPRNVFPNRRYAEVPSAIDNVSAMILEAAVGYVDRDAAIAQDRQPDDESGTDVLRRPRRNEQDEGSFPPNRPGNFPPNRPGNVPGVVTTPVVGALQDRQLVERIVDALIVNNSQNAWQSVYGIVAGTVKTPLSVELNCEIVVERLVQSMDSNPDVIQPLMLSLLDNAAPLPSENRQVCLRMFTAISANQIGRLTGFAVTEQAPGHIDGTPVPAQAAGPGFRFGTGNRGNEEGNGPGFNQPGINPVAANSPGPAPSSLPDISLAPEAVTKGANFLWSPKVVAAVVKELESITELSMASDLILFASTIPVTEVRQAMCAAFIRVHGSGSDVLNNSGVFRKVYDPAMLVVLKSLPRTRPLKETPGIMDSWTSGTEDLVLALRNELRRTSGSMKPYTDILPVKLHKNAVAEVSVVKELSAGTDAVAPAATQVYYIRTTFAPRKARDIEELTKHYEGRTSGFSRPDQAKGVMWIEGVKTLPNGHRRSMDVVIERSASGNTFNIEIVVVDTLNPQITGPGDTTQASAKQ